MTPKWTPLGTCFALWVFFFVIAKTTTKAKGEHHEGTQHTYMEKNTEKYEDLFTSSSSARSDNETYIETSIV